MLLYTPFIFFLILNGVLADTKDFSCQPGYRIAPNRRKTCEPCKEGYFQPETTQSNMCKPCLSCDKVSGSFVQEKCTRVKNTKCQCHEGFSFYASDFSICRCNKGFGLTKRGDEVMCSECPPGYFNKEYDKPCKKMTDCKDTGVKVPGSSTSDAICKEKSELTVALTSASKEAPVTLVTHRLEQNGTRTPKTRPTITTTTPQQKVPTGPPQSNRSSENHFGLGLLMIGIAGLLLLTAVTCKLHFTACWKKKRAPHVEEDSFCKPVKESGDGINSSLHLNPEP